MVAEKEEERNGAQKHISFPFDPNRSLHIYIFSDVTSEVLKTKTKKLSNIANRRGGWGWLVQNWIGLGRIFGDKYEFYDRKSVNYYSLKQLSWAAFGLEQKCG